MGEQKHGAALYEEIRTRFTSKLTSGLEGDEPWWDWLALKLVDFDKREASERAAHEETKRRLEEVERIAERASEDADTYKSALEQTRRELEITRAQRITDDDIRRVVYTHTEAGAAVQSLASLLSCSPGEVVERVKALREAAGRLCAEADDIAQGFDAWRDLQSGKKTGMGHNILVETAGRYGSLSCWLSLREWIKRTRAALSPSRPASEPAHVPQYGDPKHDMMRGPCKCGAWHDPASDPAPTHNPTFPCPRCGSTKIAHMCQPDPEPPEPKEESR